MYREAGEVLHRFSRMEILIGTPALEKLNKSKVAVFGVGGVGSYTVEALARAGVGRLVLVDYDDVCLTNINRQLHALNNTIGKSKVELMAERARLINPKLEVTAIREFYLPENGERLLPPDLNYAVDAMDTVTAKLDLIQRCHRTGIPVITCMGAGNKLDPTAFQVADIGETSVCPLAKVMRRELRKAGIPKGVKVVYSTEPPRTPVRLEADCSTHCVCTNKEAIANCARRRQIPGSISFVPSVAGLILAGVVVNDLIADCLPG